MIIITTGLHIFCNQLQSITITRLWLLQVSLQSFIIVLDWDILTRVCWKWITSLNRKFPQTASRLRMHT